MSLTNSLWRAATLKSNATISQAIDNLNKNSLKIILILTENGRLEGTISDGDIRRGLLAGLGLQNSINSIINRNPLTVPHDARGDHIKQIMLSKKIQQIPVVDENNNVLGLHTWDRLFSEKAKDNVMIIMAGGIGSRLKPFTNTCPKPLLPLNDKPILEHIINKGRSNGFKKFIISINYLGEMIEDYFGDGSNLGVHIEYLREESPLGTAGALSLIEYEIKSPFVVTNGDLVIDVDFSDIVNFHEDQYSFATMALRTFALQNPYGVVQTEGFKIIGFEEKPVTQCFINAGVYVLDPKALDYLAKGVHCDMPTLFERIKNDSKNIIAFPMHEQWMDIGRPEDYDKARNIKSN